MENLIINLNDKDYKVEFDDKDLSMIHLNGKPFRVELLKDFEDNIYSFLVNQKMAQVEFELEEDGSLAIDHEGISYQVSVTDELKKLLDVYIRTSSASSSAGHGKVKAPMPGMVVKVLVKEGLPVTKGDKIIIIEAMKMENAISSPVTGTVKSIKAREGTPVEKDALLIEIDPGKEI